MSTVNSPALVQSPASLWLNSGVPSPASIHQSTVPTVPNGQAGTSSPSPSPPSSAQKQKPKLVNGSSAVKIPSGHTGQGLLIPTDRVKEELVEHWLPRLGRLKVAREVVIRGYALYAVRQWYLSPREHLCWTIVTYTGKQSDSISAYLLVPDPELSSDQAKQELAHATQFLAAESQSHARKTEYGTLLVTTPSSFGQDLIIIPGGDFREAKPYIVINIGLRRLGCGGRAMLGMESPIPAIRRKFYELYRLPNPTTNVPLSRNASPTTSPSKSGAANGDGQSPPNLNGATMNLTSEPFTMMLIELVKIIQSALQLWGMIDENFVPDGLFCDTTKKGIFAWRRAMGMEHEESMRLEKETSGGCIDPKTLTALLSSVTSVRYQLAALGTDRLPKNPFTNTRKFLHAWHSYQESIGISHQDRVQFLTVTCLRRLNNEYLNERTRHPDAFKVHRLLASSVASATSSISANLKGGAAEDTPLRKREHHYRFRDTETDQESGIGLIIPEGQVGQVAPPDIITTDLDAYIKGIRKSREKDWDLIGARRIALLWSGEVGLRRKPSNRLDRMMRIRTTSKDTNKSDDGSESGGGPRGTFGKVTQKTGQVLKGGLGLVSRRTTMEETSDSDTGGPGPGPGSLRHTLMRKKQSSIIPTVVEPDVEEVDDQLDPLNGSPSFHTSPSKLHVDRSYGSSSTRQSVTTKTSRGGSKRLSLLTTFSMDSEPSLIRHSSFDDRTENGHAIAYSERPGDSIRALSLRQREKSRMMLRTTSDGADVILDDGGLEWTVVNPHGVFRGQRPVSEEKQALKRRNSLQDKQHYLHVIVSPVEHLAIDVDTCSIVMDLRAREKRLAQTAADLKSLEDSVFKACQDLIDAIRARTAHVTDLSARSQAMIKHVQRALEEVDDDERLQWANKKIQFYLSEDTNLNELMWNLRSLERDWERVRGKIEEGRRAVDGVGEDKSSWWKFGL